MIQSACKDKTSAGSYELSGESGSGTRRPEWASVWMDSISAAHRALAEPGKRGSSLAHRALSVYQSCYLPKTLQTLVTFEQQKKHQKKDSYHSTAQQV